MKTAPLLAKTPAERKRLQRERHRREGRVEVQAWVHPDDKARLLNYVARLHKERS